MEATFIYIFVGAYDCMMYIELERICARAFAWWSAAPVAPQGLLSTSILKAHLLQDIRDKAVRKNTAVNQASHVSRTYICIPAPSFRGLMAHARIGLTRRSRMLPVQLSYMLIRDMSHNILKRYNNFKYVLHHHGVCTRVLHTCGGQEDFFWARAARARMFVTSRVSFIPNQQYKI
jgi:hypothetical protein